MSFKEVNIIVTGGCGFVGGHLVKYLVSKKAKVTVLDILLNPKSIFSESHLKNSSHLRFIDITDREKVLKVFKNIQPKYVIHLAAESIVERAHKNPFHTFQTNVMGTVNILDASRLVKGLKGIIVASSDKAYGKTTKAYNENSPLKGDHPYDVSKSCGDLITQSYHKTYQLPIVVTRFGNIYGEGDLNFGRIIPDICQAIIKKTPLHLRSDGTFIRDYVYVMDVVEGYFFLMKNIKKLSGEAFNFSSNDNFSVLELIRLAEKVFNRKIPYKILNLAKNEIPYQHLNDKKIRNLGWKTSSTIKNTLPQILKWYQTKLLNG